MRRGIAVAFIGVVLISMAGGCGDSTRATDASNRSDLRSADSTAVGGTAGADGPFHLGDASSADSAAGRDGIETGSGGTNRSDGAAGTGGRPGSDGTYAVDGAAGSGGIDGATDTADVPLATDGALDSASAPGVDARLDADTVVDIASDQSGTSVFDGGAWDSGSGGSTLVLAELQVWHGSDKHRDAFSGASWMSNSRAYDSRDPAVVRRQISAAMAMGIQGFVVDWYGPAGSYANTLDRSFTDTATKVLFSEAETAGFKVALLYDEGAVRDAGLQDASLLQALAKTDLAYAQATYFSSPAYLHLGGRPAVFVFPYEVDSHLDWSALRSSLGTPVTLIDQDPNPTDSIHDGCFDGFFAWVQPSSDGWADDGHEWGQKYLSWFYDTMKSAPYSNKIAVGAIWPGFDDSLVRWGPGGKPRYMARGGRQVYDQTKALADQSGVGIVMIETLNDFEEGTDVEFGVEMVVDMENPAPEILVRSTPLQVVWKSSRGVLPLQVYKDGSLVYDQNRAPGSWLSLSGGTAYEIKIWAGATALAKTVKIRREDPVSGVTPVPVARDGGN